MGWKLLKPVPQHWTVVSVIVCLAAAGCNRSRCSPPGQAVPATAKLSARNTFGPSDAASDVSDTGLSEPVGSGELEAVVCPPAGWTADPIKRTRNHSHQAWLSPTRRTAYGVIRINLPLPFIGPDVVLPRFLNQMRETEGEARLLSRQNDSKLPGIRFVAEGGQYRLRTNLTTRGFRAWAIYAGTLRAEPEMPDELRLAEAAREETKTGTSRVRRRTAERSADVPLTEHALYR